MFFQASVRGKAGLLLAGSLRFCAALVFLPGSMQDRMTSEFGVVTRVLASSRFFQIGKTLEPAPKTFSEPYFMPSVLINGNAQR